MSSPSKSNPLSSRTAIFLDFDGVIKDSVEVKSVAFEQLFTLYGIDVAKRVRQHHEVNSGVSRFDKLPIYLDWAGRYPTSELVEEYSSKFSGLVKQNVIASEWVPGVVEFIKRNSEKKSYFLVTATPQGEIEEIVSALGLTRYFRKIIGAPTKKIDAIKFLLEVFFIESNQSVMIGDSTSDYQAATENGVSFVLRRTSLNIGLQEQLTCPMIEDFLDNTMTEGL